MLKRFKDFCDLDMENANRLCNVRNKLNLWANKLMVENQKICSILKFHMKFVNNINAAYGDNFN